jgi:hypothetical protein
MIDHTDEWFELKFTSTLTVDATVASWAIKNLKIQDDGTVSSRRVLK